MLEGRRIRKRAMFAVLLVGIAPHLGCDGAVLVLVEDGEGLLERLELVGRQRLEDLSAVRLRESRHRDRSLVRCLFDYSSREVGSPLLGRFAVSIRTPRPLVFPSPAAAGLVITSGGSALQDR